jgi:hypothetical protein
VSSDYERLYSVAARMLVAQGSPTWREDRWPDRRRVAFTELEAVLSEAGTPVDGDPARSLVSVGLLFPVADESLRKYLREDPEGVDDPLVVPGPLHSATTSALDELAARLVPGRPGVVLEPEAVSYGEAVHELANVVRTGLGLEPGALTRGAAVVPAGSVSGSEHERLAALAKTAADTIPAVEELGNDFSVRRDVAVAADDLRAITTGEDRPAWRERQPDIDPSRHLLTAYRWAGSEGEPVGFAVAAGELRERLTDGGPWLPSVDRPLPKSDDDLSWVLYSKRQGLITADLLDELAVRLQPVAPSGPIHFSAYPLQDFLTTTLRAGTTEI